MTILRIPGARKDRFSIILGLAAALAPVSAARAHEVYVPNYSFEAPSTSYVFPGIDYWQETAQPESFNTNVFGPWNQLIGVFLNPASTNADYIDNADGSQLAFMLALPGVGIFQDYNSTDWSNAAPSHAFNAVFQPGSAYHLTVGLTTSSEEPLAPGATLQLSLYYRDGSSNMVTIAASTVAYEPAVFTNLTHLMDFQVDVPTVKTDDAWAGRQIGVQILSTVATNLAGGVWDLDNVRLTETIDVPNFSFESPATTYVFPGIDSWEETPEPISFDTNTFGPWDQLIGVFLNPAATNADHIANAAGSQLAFLFALPEVGIFQDFNSIDWSNTAPTHAFNAVFTPGMSYTLTVGVTTSSEEPLTSGSTLELSLYYRDAGSNMVTVAASTATYDPNVFTNLTSLIDFRTTLPLVKPTDPWAGQHIGIQFLCTAPPELMGGVWDLDNVRLSEMVPITLGNPGWNNGQIGFSVNSEPGLPFEILAATNAAEAGANWTSLGTFTNATGVFSFMDAAPQLSQRFYRARQLP